MAVPLQSAEGVRSRQAAPPHPGAASFDRFFLSYAPRVRGLLRPYVGRGRADDLAQETLLRAFRRGLHLEQDGDPWPWLSRVARNLAIDASRRHRHLVEVSLDVDEDDAPVDATPHSEWLAARRREGIAVALTAIPDGPRRMLLARHLDGLRYEQIAETEGVSVAVVRSALFRAKQIFCEEYDELAARRGIKALFPLGVAGLRERLRSLRLHLEGFFHRPEAGGVSGIVPTLQLVQGAATAVALGVVATAGALLPLGEPATPAVGDRTTTPVSVPMAAIAESTGVSDGGTPVVATEPATVPPTADPAAPAPHPQPGAEAPDAGATQVPDPHRRVGGGVDTESTPVGGEVPADATASTDGGQKGDATGVSSQGEVALEADEFSTDVDDDGDADLDTTVTMSTSSSFDCSSPEEHGPVTSTACGLQATATEE